MVVPDGASSMLRVQQNGDSGDSFPASIATQLADDLHPVANPVFDRQGRLYVTLSGSRGEKVPVSVFRMERTGELTPLITDIVNPTGLAWGPDDYLYVSSRQEGSVYRVDDSGDVELLVDELGIATGLAFDEEGILYVGDRRGSIFRIEPNGEPRSFCQLEPSVSAFHLAFDDAGNLYVTGPSLSTVDAVHRVDPEGKVEVFASSFGRPQGLAFDADGNLFVTEALAGDSGVYRVDPEGERRRVVSAPPLVGLAFDGEGGLVLAGSSSLFKLEVGILGRL